MLGAPNSAGKLARLGVTSISVKHEAALMVVNSLYALSSRAVSSHFAVAFRIFTLCHFNKAKI